VWNYIERYEAVRAVYEEARGRRVDVAELKLDQAVNNGEPWAITLTLTTLGKDRGYHPKIQHDHDHSVKVVRLPAKARSVEDWQRSLPPPAAEP
jgi:hypothetical protein